MPFGSSVVLHGVFFSPYGLFFLHFPFVSLARHTPVDSLSALLLGISLGCAFVSPPVRQFFFLKTASASARLVGPYYIGPFCSLISTSSLSHPYLRCKSRLIVWSRSFDLLVCDHGPVFPFCSRTLFDTAAIPRLVFLICNSPVCQWHCVLVL